MANQAHGEPNRANPPTDSQKKKKKSPTQRIRNQTYLPFSWSRHQQRKPNPNTLIQSIQSKSKTNQNQYCVYQKKKKKPNTEPLYQNQTKKTPILAHRHHSSLAPCRRRSPLIVDRRRQIAYHLAQLRCSVLAGRSHRSLPELSSLKVFLISLSFSLLLSFSPSFFISLKV